MFRYLMIIIGVCLVASSAFGADSLKKINEPHNLGDLAVEEMWYPRQTFEIREKFSDDRHKYLKSKLRINLWESDSISIPLTFKIKIFNVPKVKLTFKATF